MNVICPKGGRHEIDWGQDGEWACSKCAQYVSLHDVMALVNAALQLTAEEAEVAAATIERESYECPELRAYIKAWPK